MLLNCFSNAWGPAEVAHVARRPGRDGWEGGRWLWLVTGERVPGQHSRRHEQGQQRTFLSARALYTSASSSAQM